MEHASSNKRPRIGSTADSSDTLSIIHSEPWLEDGNVILQTGQVRFCVHKSILSKRSNVFSDMFSLQDLQTDTEPGSLPIVQLTDSSFELSYILQWMYEPLWVTLVALIDLSLI